MIKKNEFAQIRRRWSVYLGVINENDYNHKKRIANRFILDE